MKRINKICVMVLTGMLVGAGLFVALGGEEYDRHDRRNEDIAAQDVEASAPIAPPRGYFTENVGQLANEDVHFYLSSEGMQVGFAESAVVLKITDFSNWPSNELDISEGPFSDVPSLQTGDIVRGVLVRITFENSNHVAPQGRGELSHRNNYFIGNDPDKWYPDVHNYREVVYENLYDGIDLVYRTSEKGLKYDFIVDSGGNPETIRVVYEGIEELQIDGEDLVIGTAIGDLRDSAPYSYQESGIEVKCDFVLQGQFSYGFKCEGWDGLSTLVIDPLVYSTFLGGSGYDYGWGIAVDSDKNAYVTGWVQESYDFPTTPGAFNTTGDSGNDTFVSKFTPDGSNLVYSTFLGGNGLDMGYTIEVDSVGCAYVAGVTISDDFPTTNGSYDPTYNGYADAFITKLNANGSGLLGSTYLGGSKDEAILDITLGLSDSIYVTGGTLSTDFPTTNGSYSSTLTGIEDAFVTHLNISGGGLFYSTFLGGSLYDRGHSIAVEGGNAYIAGVTWSSDYPTTNGSFDTTYNGNDDGFVTKLNLLGSSLVYSTFLGGTGKDVASSIDIDVNNSVYVTGQTESADFPVINGSYDTTYNGVGDVYIIKLDVDGSALLYSTFLGGSGFDIGYSIAVDYNGRSYVTGRVGVGSDTFPTTSGSFDPSYNGGNDTFVTVLDETGSSLLYSTFLAVDINGISNTGLSLALDDSHNVYITGVTQASGFPVTNGSFDTTFNGLVDAFVLKLGIDLGGGPGTGPGPAQGDTLISDSGNDRVIRVDYNGTIVWEYGNLNHPMDAERLADNHTLIADTSNGLVTELDSTDAIVWQYYIPAMPVDVERIGNNTLITLLSNNSVGEVDSVGSWVWYKFGLNSPMDAERLSNGNTLIAEEGNNRVIEVNPLGNIVWTYNTQTGPRDVEEVGGNILITEWYRIIEVNLMGTIVWEYPNVINATDAERLENGNTLITDLSGARVFEINLTGDVVWEKTGLNNPWDAERVADIGAETPEPPEPPTAGEAIEAVEDLIEDIEGMGLHHGMEKSLTKKLETAIKSLE
ncbi:MAG: SBBP repeat-containing protein [Methanomassiliicoccales archaeon]|nr:MAG: SBBP repeat-containing protein [Methanomassiliicoccales archaeon]